MYIEREALLGTLRKMDGVGGVAVLDREDVESTVAGFPAADVMPVVRCKDCKKSGVTEFGRRYCKEPLGMYGCVPVKDDDFCNYGKRRDTDV